MPCLTKNPGARGSRSVPRCPRGGPRPGEPCQAAAWRDRSGFAELGDQRPSRAAAVGNRATSPLSSARQSRGDRASTSMPVLPSGAGSPTLLPGAGWHPRYVPRRGSPGCRIRPGWCDVGHRLGTRRRGASRGHGKTTTGRVRAGLVLAEVTPARAASIRSVCTPVISGPDVAHGGPLQSSPARRSP